MSDHLLPFFIMYPIMSIVISGIIIYNYTQTNPKGQVVCNNLTDRASLIGFIIASILGVVWCPFFIIYQIYKSFQELFQGLTKESPPNLEHTFEQVDFTIKETEQLLQKVRTE